MDEQDRSIGFYHDDPYENFPLEEHPSDTQGWGSNHPIFAYLIKRLRPALIFEVGTWKGRSALNMARQVKRLSLDTKIVCIDTWLGAPEHYLRPDHYKSLRIAHGYPRLFHTFMGNVLRAGVQDVIVPLPQTSDNAAVLLRKKGLRADMIYIDAAHEYESVLRDLQAYWELLTTSGCLFGDDYPKGRGVGRAVHEFCSTQGLSLVAGGGKFAVVSDQDFDFASVGMTPVAL